MPTVTLDKATVLSLVGKKLSDAQLKDRISMLGTDLEEVTNEHIVVEVFPNRPDLLSEQGMARALKSFLGLAPGLKQYSIKSSGKQVHVDKNVKMRPYTACAIVKNLTFNDERIRQIVQVQEKLAATHGRNRKKSAYGLYPLDKINFPVTYTAKNPAKVTFWPLGAEKPMLASKIEELHPKGRAFKDVAKGWKLYPFFIDAKDQVMSMLPYTNSEDFGKIDESTTELFIECSGVDQHNVNLALNIIVTVLADMGGDVYSLDVVYHDQTITTPNLLPSEMKVDPDLIRNLIGIDFSDKDIKTYLNHMGYDYSAGVAKVPAYRADIMHPVDLMEDVAIAYGYENLDPQIPAVATIAKEAPFSVFVEKLTDVMVGLGLQEVKNYHLLNQTDLNVKMRTKLDAVALAHANEEYNYLRPWILPCLMKTLSKNVHHEYPQHLFEIAKVFLKDSKQESHVAEPTRLGAVWCAEGVDFTLAKQGLDNLLRGLGLSYEIVEVEHPSFIDGRAGRVIVEGVKVAYIGELHPEVLTNWNVLTPAVGFEINVSELWKLVK